VRFHPASIGNCFTDLLAKSASHRPELFHRSVRSVSQNKKMFTPEFETETYLIVVQIKGALMNNLLFVVDFITVNSILRTRTQAIVNSSYV